MLYPKKGDRFEAAAEALGLYVGFQNAAWDHLALMPGSTLLSQRLLKDQEVGCCLH